MRLHTIFCWGIDLWKSSIHLSPQTRLYLIPPSMVALKAVLLESLLGRVHSRAEASTESLSSLEPDEHTQQQLGHSQCAQATDRSGKRNWRRLVSERMQGEGRENLDWERRNARDSGRPLACQTHPTQPVPKGCCHREHNRNNILYLNPVAKNPSDSLNEQLMVVSKTHWFVFSCIPSGT